MTLKDETRRQAGRAFHCSSLMLAVVHASQPIGYQERTVVSVDLILPKLSGLRQTRPYQWIACCPGHDDRRASLSIRELPGGQVLIHCFAGCSVDEVIGSIGVAIDDLFPQRVLPERYKRERRLFDPVAVLYAIAHETAVVGLIAEDLAAGRLVDADRLWVAVGRIHRALDAVGEPRVPEELRRARRGTAQ